MYQAWCQVFFPIEPTHLPCISILYKLDLSIFNLSLIFRLLTF